ncbi:fucose permease [Dysgonomonas sp. PH5-45]|uniref:hypothetical protein n=1 Tax=unclassified Dysgonomonas TaxID=2630389 RepID=UPI002475A0A3|nr:MULTISPECIES: hypothetical protein [unclassified Dysgonomonas]MDH6354552.1 fucose permease [Dysgonomonas sp. PH5-45]MDH6387392.1 fucose permease [Dysgonomonas sp. PH5-37]
MDFWSFMTLAGTLDLTEIVVSTILHIIFLVYVVNRIHNSYLLTRKETKKYVIIACINPVIGALLFFGDESKKRKEKYQRK